MKKLNIVECTGYSREEAFAELPFNPFYFNGSNSTRSWKKCGSPIPGTSQFEEWATQQLEAKTRNLDGYGLYIILDKYIPDTRVNPCKLYNSRTTGRSTWHLEYWLREDEFDPLNESQLLSTGPIIFTSIHKEDLKKVAKELTLKTHKSYSFLRVKVPNNNFISGQCIYSPSNSAKIGTFIAFGYNK